MKIKIFFSLIFFFYLSIASGAGLSETPCRESLGLGSNDEVGFKSVTLTEKVKAKNIEVYGGAGISVLAGSNSTNTQTNSTNKIMRFGVPHYLAAEEPMAVVFADSGNAENKLCFGGATAQMNAATSIHFFTAPNSTTTTGSSRMTIKDTGIINIDQTPTYADNAAAKSGGLVAGDIYRTSTGVLMIVY